MKDKDLIKANLIQKVALVNSRFCDTDIIRTQIVMLDWVLSENETVRDIKVILKEYPGGR